MAFANVLTPLPACAQEIVPVRSPLTFDAAPLSPADAASQETGVAKSFVRDVGSDYKKFFSIETAEWLGIGSLVALGIHEADQSIANAAQANPHTLPGGSVYGSQLFQIPVAIAWWIVGTATGSESQAAVGRDLLRAQILVFGWTYGIKFATDRTRPNGDPHSLPSGHASASFATAMVLQEHFGWKVGLPAFAAAAYTGASRVTANEHWTSDVVLGAALGMACGRTGTIRLRDTRISVAPRTVPGGMSVMITVLR